jgi:hypothetical protein
MQSPVQRWDDARAAVEEALRLNPADATALRNLQELNYYTKPVVLVGGAWAVGNGIAVTTSRPLHPHPACTMLHGPSTRLGWHAPTRDVELGFACRTQVAD